jgi:ribokinase
LLAARLGAPTELIGRIGTDDASVVLLAALREAGVGIGGLTRHGESGLGVVFTDPRGGNWIGVAPRANAQLSVADVERHAALIAGARVLLTQLEIPLPAVTAALRIARANGVTTILNPAPARPLSKSILRLVDVLIPNETEAERLTGHRISGIRSARVAAEALRARGPERVIVTLGRHGLFCAGPGETIHLPASPVGRAADPTGAGDAFCGALGAALAEGRSWPDALRLGSAAGSLSVRREGAISSLPSRSEVDAFMDASVSPR